ncbi:hypothetical protein Ahy_B01g051908 [Arachis hypogaea]|uniref:Serine-threonine/tyrosine-protein kinase catalytic domain-containing protein n=1 Tax=Arachis hypogaea TaxID=3818 RepID=A0A445AN71_ARAHY|nr:hypothetical protein Ahy_B01g051908 [Arachis hypogaea]
MVLQLQRDITQEEYGIIYKASLNDDRQVVVKVLKESKGSVKKIVNKVVIICRTSHVNIIKLSEFCYEKITKHLFINSCLIVLWINSYISRNFSISFLI